MFFNLVLFRLNDPNHILRALILSDNGFLLTLLVIAVLNLWDFDLENCKDYRIVAYRLTRYFKLVFRFLSSWYIVAFSLERYAIVYFPFSKYKVVNNKNKTFTITSLLIISLLLHSYAFFDLESTSKKSWNKFDRNYRYDKLILTFNFFLTIFVPFLIIFFINFLIVYKLIKTIREKKFNILRRRSIRVDLSTGTGMTDERCSLSYREDNLTEFVIIRREKKYFRTAKKLLFILTTFLVLNMPLAYSTVRFVLFNFSVFDKNTEKLDSNKTHLLENLTSSGSNERAKNSNFFSMLEGIIVFIAEPLHYLNFSINFFLYAFDRTKLKFSTVFSCFTCKCRNRNADEVYQYY